MMNDEHEYMEYKKRYDKLSIEEKRFIKPLIFEEWKIQKKILNELIENTTLVSTILFMVIFVVGIILAGAIILYIKHNNLI